MKDHFTGHLLVKGLATSYNVSPNLGTSVNPLRDIFLSLWRLSILIVFKG